MSIKEKFIILNISALIGIFLSIFMVPENTRLWLWATNAAVVLAILNILLYRHRHAKPTLDSRDRTVMSIIAAMLVIISLVAERYPK